MVVSTVTFGKLGFCVKRDRKWSTTLFIPSDCPLARSVELPWREYGCWIRQKDGRIDWFVDSDFRNSRELIIPTEITNCAVSMLGG